MSVCRFVVDMVRAREYDEKKKLREFHGDPGVYVVWVVQWLELIGNPELALCVQQVYKLNR